MAGLGRTTGREIVRTDENGRRELETPGARAEKSDPVRGLVGELPSVFSEEPLPREGLKALADPSASITTSGPARLFGDAQQVSVRLNAAGGTALAALAALGLEIGGTQGLVVLAGLGLAAAGVGLLAGVFSKGHGEGSPQPSETRQAWLVGDEFEQFCFTDVVVDPETGFVREFLSDIDDPSHGIPAWELAEMEKSFLHAGVEVNCRSWEAVIDENGYAQDSYGYLLIEKDALNQAISEGRLTIKVDADGRLRIIDIRKVFEQTDNDYLTKTLATRQPGAEGSGSRFASPITPEELAAADWVRYKHKDVQAPAIAFRAAIPGRVGVVSLESLDSEASVILRDRKGTGFLEAEFPMALGPQVEHTTLLVGPDRDDPSKLTVWTFFPGDPVMPSRLEVSGDYHDGMTMTVREAIASGMAFVKAVEVSPIEELETKAGWALSLADSLKGSGPQEQHVREIAKTYLSEAKALRQQTLGQSPNMRKLSREAFEDRLRKGDGGFEYQAGDSHLTITETVSYEGMFVHPVGGAHAKTRYENMITTRGAEVMVTTVAVKNTVGSLGRDAESPGEIIGYRVFGSRGDDDLYGGGFFVMTADRRIVEEIHMEVVRHIEDGLTISDAYGMIQENAQWADLMVWGG